MSRHVRIVVSGRVQNIGFRMFALEHARALGLHGWVRNLPGGRQVELEAEGEDGAIGRLIQAVRYGPPGARVDDLLVEDLVGGLGMQGFTVR